MNTRILLVSAVSLLLATCGDDGPSTKSIEVALAYPSQGRGQENTSSVRIWVLSPLQDELSCAQVVSKETEPFAVQDFTRFADVVFNVSESPPPLVIDEVTGSGRVFVYGEVTDYVGTTILAGCDDLASIGDATLALVKPGSFDCTDAATPDGAPCDDGLFCSVGEECSGGSCSGGIARSCDFLEDQCNGSMCSEELGCQPVPSPPGTNCEDGSACTLADSCDGAGACTPGAVDCTADGAGICVVGTCNAAFQVCEAIDSDSTQSTADDTCTNLANIEVTDCYQLSTIDECNGSTGRCNLTTLISPPVNCTNQCTTDGTCSGTTCIGGTPVASPEEATEVTCNDSRDNDCDNLIDCADSDCSASPDCAL